MILKGKGGGLRTHNGNKKNLKNARTYTGIYPNFKVGGCLNKMQECVDRCINGATGECEDVVVVKQVAYADEARHE
jgi:hypothetical protein